MAGAAVAVVLVVCAVLASLPGATNHAAPATPATAAPSVLDQPRVNVLLLGSDAGPDRVGTRPDSIIVASIDTHTGATTLFGLPRNLEHVPFPAGTAQARAYPRGWACADHSCLLNSLWQWAETSGAKYYPGVKDAGLTATREGAEQATGLTVDETVVVTMKGLASAVDAVGGVDVTVGERLPIGGNAKNLTAQGWLEKGKQHLNGEQALWYARSRWSTNDYSRMARQQCLLADLVDQVDGARLARAYPALIKTLSSDVRTSIRPADLPGWISLAARMKSGGVRTVGLSGVGQGADPDFGKMHALVSGILQGSGQVHGNPYGDPC